MGEYVVMQKKTKQIILILAAFLMISSSIFPILVAVMASSFGIEITVFHQFLFLVVGFFGVAFFGICLAFLLKRLFFPKPILILSPAGVFDQSSLSSFGFIPWRDIMYIEITSLVGNSFISLEVSDAERYLEALPPFKQKIMRANEKMGFPFFNITLQTGDRNIEEVLAVMRNYQMQYGVQRSVAAPPSNW